jgi:putative hemolysin
MQDDPFRLDTLPLAPLHRAALAAARPLLERVLGLEDCRTEYRRIQELSGAPFIDRALHALDIAPIWTEEELERIPAQGPLIVAANHPHGVLDGLLLDSLLRRVRPDVRLVVNHMLARFAELRETCFFVDPFEGPESQARSRSGLRAAHRWLRRGGALVVFPAGEVAHHRAPDGAIAESDWKVTAGRLAAAAQATVLPAFIEGRNSRLFYAAGRIHPALRTGLLLRELLGQRGRRVRVRLGTPVRVGALGPRADPPAITAALRGAVLDLARTSASAPRLVTTVAGARAESQSIAREIDDLAPDHRLLSSGGFDVYVADAREIPLALREIGRLREITYRAIGEGTGREIDLDRFDERYLHLFSWDCDAQRIVGAYRLGRTDHIVGAEGVEGLYTRTLFRYDRRLIDLLSPALELGRSFVRAEYQRHHSALLLLWKGIGRFIARHPEYRVLFGPVSISTRYSDSTHALLMAFLQQNHLARELAELVTALNPARVAPAAGAGSSVPATLDQAERAVCALEPDGQGMPVLLRQYLKLNARLIGFNIDPDFGQALDALMMVDLTAVDEAMLNRYLGREETAAFLARHRGGASSRPAA